MKPRLNYTQQFAAAVAGVGFPVGEGFLDLYMDGGASGATFQWEISHDRDNVANDGAATWSVCSLDATGTPNSYALGANVRRSIKFQNNDARAWLRPVCTNYIAGTPQCHAR